MLLLLCINSFAQNIGIGTNTPNASAALEISSSNKGLLLPRVSDTTAVPAPAKGLVVYSNANNKLWYFDGNHWQQTISGAAGMDSIWYKLQDSIVYTNKKFVGINTNLSLLPLQANLQVTGTMLAQQAFTYPVNAPGGGQLIKMDIRPQLKAHLRLIARDKFWIPAVPACIT